MPELVIFAGVAFCDEFPELESKQVV